MGIAITNLLSRVCLSGIIAENSVSSIIYILCEENVLVRAMAQAKESIHNHFSQGSLQKSLKCGQRTAHDNCNFAELSLPDPYSGKPFTQRAVPYLDCTEMRHCVGLSDIKHTS